MNIISHITADESEVLVPGQMRDIRRGPGDEVVQADDRMTLVEQPFAQV